MRGPRRAGRPGAGRRAAVGPLLGIGLVALAALAGCATGSPAGPGGGGDGSVGDDATDEPGDPDAGQAAGTTDLTITVDEAGDGVEVRTFTLTCDPAGGTHRDPEAACAALATDAVLAALQPPPPDRACTEQYGGPQVATVVGTLDGEPVDVQLSRTNGCEISRWAALGTVIDHSGEGV